MSETYYKAVRPNGGSFHDPEFRWLPEGWGSGDPIPMGWVVEHPNPGERIEKDSGARANEYLSVATVPTDCTGFEWPCVLLEVQAVGRACLDSYYPNKRRVRGARIIRELPAHEAFGPQGAEVVAILYRAVRLTTDEVEKLSDAQWSNQGSVLYAARNAEWRAGASSREAARTASRKVVQNTVGDAAWPFVRDAIFATLNRDLIGSEQHELLMAPWRAVIGDGLLAILRGAGWTDHKATD